MVLTDDEKLKRVVEWRRVALSFDDDAVFDENYAEIVAFGAGLRKKYGHTAAEQYELFHVLAGSTMSDPLPHFDFEGEDSVFLFFERLTAPKKGTP